MRCPVRLQKRRVGRKLDSGFGLLMGEIGFCILRPQLIAVFSEGLGAVDMGASPHTPVLAALEETA